MKPSSAAAPCPPSLREHYHALGVPFGENFAMTEVGSATTQRPGLVDFGTLGPAAPGYELRIAEDGELLIRSPYTASRYRNQISIVNGKKAGTDINLYKLFVEQCFNLLRAGGRCGIITPGSVTSPSNGISTSSTGVPNERHRSASSP